MGRRRRPNAVFLGACVLLAGCGFFRSDYHGRLAVWRSKEPAAYRWTLVVSEPVFGPRPITVLVEDGEPVEASSDTEQLEIDGDEADGLPATVDALIEHLIESSPDAISVNVEWASAGYPSRIRLDHSDAIDDEVSYTVESFQPLEPAP